MNSKAAFVWVLGAFGEQIEDSAYILEKVIEEEVETNSTELQMILLISCTRLFFKKAPQMHSILGKYYQYILK